MKNNHAFAEAESLPGKSCRVTVSQQQPPWEVFLGRHSEATLFYDPRWGEIMRMTYKNPCFYLTAWREQTVVGILQLVHQKSRLFGSQLCSLPYFDASGILADESSVEHALLCEAESLRNSLGARHVELRQMLLLPGNLPVRKDKVKMCLALPASVDALMLRFKPKLRQELRKPRPENIDVKFGGAELVQEFHAVYIKKMRELGSPPHKQKFFQLLMEMFGPAAKIFVARSHHQVVAAVLTLTDSQGMHALWSGSELSRKEYLINRQLFWSMLIHAVENGIPGFDFGRSTRNSGTYEFKTKWGTQEFPLYWHYVIPKGGQPPLPFTDEAKYRFITSVWRRLPLRLIKAWGPRIIGKLS